MQAYIIKRILMLFPVLLVASIIIFSISRFIPGDAAELLIQTGNVESIQALRSKLGLDRPVHEQYLSWVWDVVHGNMGDSLVTGDPVLSTILRKLPISVELAFLAMIISVSIAIVCGLVSAAREETWVDYVVRVLGIAGLAVPGFWIGTLMIGFGALWFRYVPPVGYVALWEDPSRNIQQFIFPAIALGAALAATTMRLTRSSLLDVLRQDYITTAWSKGLRESVVLYRHALKNAMIPVITVMGNQLGYLLGGTVIMELIFSLPGLGRSTLQALFDRDYPQLQGNILTVVVMYVLVNLLVDISYSWLDPRIRYR